MLPRGFLSIRDLFEADLLESQRRSGDYSRIERNTVSSTQESQSQKRLKDEVYAITGAGGSLLVLTILISLMIVR